MMEVVVFIAMMVVPIFSLVSLFMAIMALRKIQRLKELVITSMKTSRDEKVKSELSRYSVMEL